MAPKYNGGNKKNSREEKCAGENGGIIFLQFYLN
jgi:hypothetical protein